MRIPATLAAVLLMAAAGCVTPPAGEISLWATGPSEWVRPNDPPRSDTDFYSQARNQIELSGAVNEVIQWQIALISDRAIVAATPEFSALVGTGGTLPPENFQAYVERSVRIAPVSASYLRRYGGGAAALDVPDILVPLASPSLGGAVPILPPRATVLWAEYAVPRGAAPGAYHGTLTIRAGAQALRRVAVNLTVYPFALPGARHLAILAGIDAPRLVAAMMPEARGAAGTLTARANDATQARAARLVQDAGRLLHEHRVDPYLTHVYPPMRFAADGSVELNWQAYDALAGPLIDGQAYADAEPPRYWPLPVDRSRPSPEAMGGLDSPEYARVLRETLAAGRAHFQAKGWPARLCVDLTAAIPDEPRAGDYDTARRLGQIARLADPKLLHMVNLFPVSMRAYGWPGQTWSDLSDVADIWAPSAQFFAPERLSQARRLGARTWLRPDQPEFAGSAAAGATPVDTRAIGWHAWLTESDVWLPQAADWPAEISPSRPLPWREDATWLLYPGAIAGVDGLLPSLRLKHLLRAAQDYEYLWLLRQNDREATARLTAESMVKATGMDAALDNYADPATHECVLEPDVWELARRLIAEELSEAVRGSVARKDPLEQRLNWGRLLTATRQVLLWSDGVRWTDAPAGTAAGWNVEFHVTVENQKRLPVRGRLSFGPLPPGWRAVTEPILIGPLPERGRGRYKLVARADAWPITLDGHLEQPIKLTLDAGETIGLKAAVSTLLAARVSRPVQIDGRLDDWELGRGNVAGDFAAIGPGPRAGGAGPRPQRTGDATMAYVARDADSLYVAVRCLGGPRADAGEARDNRVHYDGLVPIGEELVELLIDPSNSGADSSELFHMVFWRHGAWWAERGVSTSRPTAAVRPWAPDIRYATHVEASGWTIEARIPLSAFDPSVHRSRIWGLNFARFSAGEGQYANWSAALRYCYNPRSLGNLAWGE